MWVSFEKRRRLEANLLFENIDVILVDVSITNRVHKFARLQITNMGNHMRQQCIARNVERHSKTLPNTQT